MQLEFTSILSIAALCACIAAPAAAAPAAAPAKTGAAAAAKANEYTTEADAKGHCAAGVVVWVNFKSHVYHFAGSKPYGHTKSGAYMCESDATAAGDHAAKGEKRS